MKYKSKGIALPATELLLPEVFTEHYTNQKKLFSSVSKILRKHGLYTIEVEENDDEICDKEIIGYTLRYWFYQVDVYRVIKGKDGAPFQFLHMPYEIDGYKDKNYMPLKKGAILVYETEYDDEVWFTCITMLRGKKAMESESAMGSVNYGSLSDMLQQGLIEKIPSGVDSSSTPAEKSKTERKKRRTKKAPLKETPVPQEEPPVQEIPVAAEAQEPVTANADVQQEKDGLTEQELEYDYGSFETIKNTFNTLKSAVGNITQVRHYSNREMPNSIRTIKITEISYPGAYDHYIHVPHVRVAGRYIERAGFKKGDFAQIITMKDMVLIVPVRPLSNFSDQG